MNKIPETKEEWDLLPDEVRERLGQFAFIDTVKQITDSINESIPQDEELDFKKILEAPERSHRLFSRGWFFEKAQKRYYRTLRGK